MTDIDNFGNSWQGLTHGEVEDAIKAKAAQVDTSIAEKYTKPSGGIPKTDLSSAVQDALDNAGSGSVTAVKMNNGTPIEPNSNGVIDLGTVITEHQDISDKADKSEMSVGAESNGKRNVTLKSGASVDVVTSVKTVNNESVLGSGNITIPDGADGKSAYDIACENDFVGTEAEWLESLKGADGLTGNYEIAVVHNTDGTPSGVDDDVAVLGADVGKLLQEQVNAAGGGAIRIVGDTLEILSVTSPRMWVLPATPVLFEDTIFGSTKTKKIHVYGRNLVSAVSVAVSGVGFSGSTALYPDLDGNVDEEVTITFAPTSSTGTETQTEGVNEYSGQVTISNEDTEQIVLSMGGVGMDAITPRITASIDNAALKGVTSDIASSDYSDVPSKATLHIEATNIDAPLTLSVSDAKFTLSVNQISVEDAQRGVDVEVGYVRQSAVTQTPDSATITVTGAYGQETASVTVQVTGDTGAKTTTSGAIIHTDTVHNVKYRWNGTKLEMVCVGANGTTNTVTGDLVIPSYICDEYGYKYIPKVLDYCRSSSNLTSLSAEGDIDLIGGNAFNGCTGLRSITMQNVTSSRNGMFKDCTALETLDIVSMQFTYSSKDYFQGCTKLSAVIVRKDTGTAGEVNVTLDSNTVFDTGAVDGITGDVFIYVENGVNKQKKLYVPAGRKAAYAAHSYWGLFDVHGIDEL